ncbi:MAG: TonB-dependent receptor, partial [Burkholderiales bacterium]
AWIQNGGTIPGVVAKAGRFLSGIGYINQQHPHAWDFADAPWVQQVFFGGNLADDGVQLRYIAPTPLFLEFGLEAGRGANFPGSETNDNGANAGAVFANLGGDVGFSNSYLIGASYRQTQADEREYDDFDSASNEIENIFTDLESKIWGASLVWKWAPDGDPSIRNFKFQTEYFWREEDGQLGYDYDDGTGTFAQEGPYSSTQSGWYAQAVWQFMPRWRVGARYDQLDSGDLEYQPISNGSITREDLQLLQENEPKRYTAMVDFSTSEFARFRLQYEYDEARYDVTDQLIIFQYVVSLGAHGAHKF